jgi:hypothetical protein
VSENKKQGKAHQPKTVGSASRRKKRKGMGWEDRPCLEPNAGGIDIGAREIFVAVPPDRDECPVRVFDTFTDDLQAMVQWLKAWGHDRGHGIDGRVLDSALRHSGSARHQTMSDQCAAYAKCSGATNGLA